MATMDMRIVVAPVLNYVLNYLIPAATRRSPNSSADASNSEGSRYMAVLVPKMLMLVISIILVFFTSASIKISIDLPLAFQFKRLTWLIAVTILAAYFFSPSEFWHFYFAAILAGPWLGKLYKTLKIHSPTIPASNHPGHLQEEEEEEEEAKAVAGGDDETNTQVRLIQLDDDDDDDDSDNEYLRICYGHA